MCHYCGYTPCQCVSNMPSYNWYSLSTQPCSPCESTPTVCKKKVPTLCVEYNGPNLPNLGINTGDNLNDILNKLDNIKMIQDTKFANLLAAINDINDRLNDEGVGSEHPPYTLL